MINDGTSAALIVMLGIWLLPLCVPGFLKTVPMVLAYWFLIALHQWVAITNAYWFVTIGADADAATFHRIGLELAQSQEWSFAIGSKFYEQMLGIVYWMFGSSHLLGQQLSILAFSFSCVVLIRMLRLLKLSYYSWPILLFFGALPTMFLLGSVTLRESYQTLFFMLAVYFGLKYLIYKQLRFFVGTAIFALIMGLFHKGLVVFALFYIMLMLAWQLKPEAGRLLNYKGRLLGFVLTLFVAGGGYALLKNIGGVGGISGIEVLTSLADGRGLEYVEDYRERSVDSRATYGVMLNTSSWLALLASSLQVYFFYLFAPLPWQVSNIFDLYALAESAWRAALIFYAVKAWRNSYGPQRKLFALLLLLYFSMAFLWALGTTNYGTAIRHHMVNYWIILVLGLPPLWDSVIRLVRGYFNRYIRSDNKKVGLIN